MANLVVSLIMVAVILTVTTLVAHSSLEPQGTLTDSWKAMRSRTREAASTAMESQGVAVQDSGAEVQLTVLNTGQTPLRDASSWDLFIAYHQTAGNADIRLARLAYTESTDPAAGEWTLEGIYLDAASGDQEVFNTGIVDPGEAMLITARLSPVIGASTDNSISLAVTSGVTLSATFSY